MDQGNSSTNSAGLMDKMRQGASSQLSTQKDRAIDGIGSVAQAVRQSTQRLRDQHHETIAHYIDETANQLERFSDRLRDKDVGELVRDAQRFAKRRPAVFIGSAFAAGLMAARFFKSSRDRQSNGDGRNSYARSSSDYSTRPRPLSTTSASATTRSSSNASQG
jgi:hypothetical protein